MLNLIDRACKNSLCVKFFFPKLEIVDGPEYFQILLPSQHACEVSGTNAALLPGPPRVPIRQTSANFEWVKRLYNAVAAVFGKLEIGSILNPLAGKVSEDTRKKGRGAKTGTPHDWRSFYLS